jgi:hypothetical protein
MLYLIHIKTQLSCRFPVSYCRSLREHSKIWNLLYTLASIHVATAIKAICKCCREALDVIQILIPYPLPFLIIWVHLISWPECSSSSCHFSSYSSFSIVYILIVQWMRSLQCYSFFKVLPTLHWDILLEDHCVIVDRRVTHPNDLETYAGRSISSW